MAGSVGVTIRLLLAEASSTCGRALTSALAREGGFDAESCAAQPSIILQRLRDGAPDVVLFSSPLLKGDAVELLGEIMGAWPAPVVILLERSPEAPATRTRMLRSGAVAVVIRPTGAEIAAAGPDALPFLAELLPLLHRAARVKVVRIATPRGDGTISSAPPRRSGIPPRFDEQDAMMPPRLIVVGSSTGGPNVLQTILPALPADMNAAVVVAQHMPDGFTSDLARSLDALCPMTVSEVRSGDRLKVGHVHIAPGRHNLTVRFDGRLLLEPASTGLHHIPSVDQLFTSAAAAGGPRTMAVVLTGMGRDGTEGVRAVKAAGGRVLAQDAATSTVFGMPAEAAATGCVDFQLPPAELAAHILAFAGRATANPVG